MKTRKMTRASEERILDRLEKIDNKIDKLSDKVSENSINIVGIEALKHDIYGNGKKGVIKKVEENTDKINFITKKFALISICIIFGSMGAEKGLGLLIKILTSL